MASPFEVEPSECLFTVACSVLSGPRSDLCDISDGFTVGQLDMNGVYTFQSNDVGAYPAGDYVFEITGTAGTHGDQTSTQTFTLTLVDPCPTSSLSLDPSAALS